MRTAPRESEVILAHLCIKKIRVVHWIPEEIFDYSIANVHFKLPSWRKENNKNQVHSGFSQT